MIPLALVLLIHVVVVTNSPHLVLPLYPVQGITANVSYTETQQGVLELSSVPANVSFYVVPQSGYLNFSSPTPGNLYLLVPLNIGPYSVEPQPTRASIQHGVLCMEFQDQNVSLELEPQGVVSTGEQTGGSYLLLVLLAVSGGSSVFLGYLTFFKFRNRDREEDLEYISGLDERDRLVLNAVKQGKNSLGDIMRATNLPKTTTYRRLKRLVSMGYLEELRESGKITYRVKEGKD